MTRPTGSPVLSSSHPARKAAATRPAPRVLLICTGTPYCQSLGFPRPNASFP
jgi:hypothetical protein